MVRVRRLTKTAVHYRFVQSLYASKLDGEPNKEVITEAITKIGLEVVS